MLRDFVGEPIRQLVATYDPEGSLASTHIDQGTDMGLYGGILGWLPDDHRLPRYLDEIDKLGINVRVDYAPLEATHPNHYRLEVIGASGTVYTMDALSTGGGMLELVAIDEIPAGGYGDRHSTFFWLNEKPNDALFSKSGPALSAEEIDWLPDEDAKGLLRFDSVVEPDPEEVAQLAEALGATRHRIVHAVMPILTKMEMTLPFERCGEMERFAEKGDYNLWQCAVEYEAQRGGVSHQEVIDRMKRLASTMEAAVQSGLAGTHYDDRILPAQNQKLASAEKEGLVIPAEINNKIIRYVSAIMEVKSSMGVIVAAPTAGSCGAMPGAVIAVAEALGANETKRAKALLVAGMIGVFIAKDATFAAEEGGCMAECGSGSSMAAAAIVHLAGGTLDQQVAAASLALQNSLGMVCDPIANRVEAPCLGKNVMAASNALSCANMAIAGYDHLVPLDEVIVAMNKVAHQIPRELRCTNLGGLSITPTASKIAAKLAANADQCCKKSPVEQ
mgnify:CR=1 FL=1